MPASQHLPGLPLIKKRRFAVLLAGERRPTASRVYFSILQAADYTTATPSWIEEQLRNGKLPYRWIGTKRVIFRRDLDELMESLPAETGLCDVPAFMEKRRRRAQAEPVRNKPGGE